MTLAAALSYGSPEPPFEPAPVREQQRSGPSFGTRRCPASEAGAAIAHRINEPLTALLLYLHAIKSDNERTGDRDIAAGCPKEMIENALRETIRLCDIMRSLAELREARAEVEIAIARGRDAISLLSGSREEVANGEMTSPPAYVVGRPLTPRETEVRGLIVAGASNKQGGRELGISTRTFEVHRARIMGKMGARNAADLVRISLTSQG